MKRKLFHFRAHDLEQRLQPEGGMTLALQYDEERQRLSYGVSIAVPLDMFNRRRGRDIANGRLEKFLKKGPGFCRGLITDVSFTGIKDAMSMILDMSIDQLDARLMDTHENMLKITFLWQRVFWHHRDHGILSKKKEEVKE